MDQKNNRADPDFKDQFREAVETIGDGGTRVLATTAGELLPTAMNRIPRSGGRAGGDPSFKAQIQRGLKNGRLTPPPPVNNGNDVPIAQAVAVDNNTSNSDGVPVVVPPTPTAQEDSVVMVLKISKRTLYWLLGILVLIIGVSTIIGGVCSSGKCRRTDNNGNRTSSAVGGGDSNGGPSSNLRPTVHAGPPTAAPPASTTTTTPCSTGDDCPLGTCARESLTTQNMVCCPAGASEYLFDPINAAICTGQPAGAVCTNDSLCASNACFQQACLAERQRGGSVMCDSNSDCTGTCVVGTCTEGLFAETGMVCDDAEDCALGVCARATVSTGYICCSTGNFEFFESDDVCTGQLTGAVCGELDTLCQSGTCFQGMCLATEQADGQPCDSNADCRGACVGGICTDNLRSPGEACDDDSDCSNKVCGLLTVLSNKAVCCPTSQAEYCFGCPVSASVCTGQATGAMCGELDSVCQSGACLGGTCLADRQANGQRCDSNADCIGSTCTSGICSDILSQPPTTTPIE
jgi:hypothetical protein